jgi:hypothetical protein
LWRTNQTACCRGEKWKLPGDYLNTSLINAG